MAWMDLHSDLSDEFSDLRAEFLDNDHWLLSVRHRPNLAESWIFTRACEKSSRFVRGRREKIDRAPGGMVTAAKPEWRRQSRATPSECLCAWCGELSRRAHSKGRAHKFCSDKCCKKHWLHNNRPAHREHQRRYMRRLLDARMAERAATQLNCVYCAVTFSRTASGCGPVPRFCSRQCEGGFRRRGHLGPPAAEKIQKVCIGCSAQFLALNTKRVFCNRECKDRYRWRRK